jgi:hypothetical protein
MISHKRVMALCAITLLCEIIINKGGNDDLRGATASTHF